MFQVDAYDALSIMREKRRMLRARGKVRHYMFLEKEGMKGLSYQGLRLLNHNT